MNRRNILRTAFGASIAAALGLTIGCCDVKCKHDNKTATAKEKTDTEKTLEFYAFFEEVNGFPINAEQKDAYHFYIKKYRMYSAPRQLGMSTLQNTIAFHEAYVNKKKVAVTVPNASMGYRHYEITIDQIKRHKDLNIKEIANTSIDRTVLFPGEGSITFIVTTSSKHMDQLRSFEFDLRLVNIDAVKYPGTAGFLDLHKLPICKGQTYMLGTTEYQKVI